MVKRFVLIVVLFIGVCTMQPQMLRAQCSMCTVNAEQGTKNGNTQGKGLNDGILYLLALPYLLIAGVGVIWYRSYRKKLNEKPAPSL